MTRVKALKIFLEKFFNYKSEGMTIPEILNDVTEHGTVPSGGSDVDISLQEKSLVINTQKGE